MRNYCPRFSADLLAAVCFVLSSAAHADPELQWEKTFDEANSSADGARAIEVTGSGDLVSAGQLGGKFALMKQASANGNKLWAQLLPLGTGTGSGANALVLDASGDAFAAGVIANGASGSDFAVARIAGGDGSVVWTRLVNGSAKGDDSASGVALDGNGDVFAVGQLANTATGLDVAVVKLDGDTGAIIWQKALNGSPFASISDGAYAVAVDDNDNPIVVGYFGSTTQSYKPEFAVIKLAGTTGVLLWLRRYAPEAFAGFATSVVVDSSENAFVGGTLDGHFTVMKFRVNSGLKSWQYQHAVTSFSPPSLAVDLTLTSDGVLAAGHTGSSGTAHTLVVKLGTFFGGPLWEKYVAPSGTSWSGAYAVETSSGEVLAASHSTGTAYVTRHKEADGEKIWTFHPGESSARPSVIAIQGNSLFVAGRTPKGRPTGTDLWTLKLGVIPSCVVGTQTRTECANHD